MVSTTYFLLGPHIGTPHYLMFFNLHLMYNNCSDFLLNLIIVCPPETTKIGSEFAFAQDFPTGCKFIKPTFEHHLAPGWWKGGPRHTCDDKDVENIIISPKIHRSNLKTAHSCFSHLLEVNHILFPSPYNNTSFCCYILYFI